MIGYMFNKINYKALKVMLNIIKQQYNNSLCLSAKKDFKYKVLI